MSNINRDDVINFLADLSAEEILEILKEIRDHQIEVNSYGYYTWHSGVMEVFSSDTMTDEDIEEEELPEWLNASKGHHVTFYRQMTDKGYEVYHYRGRGFYDGPGVNVNRHEVDTAIRACKVRLQRDNMGLDMVIYPEN